MRTHVPPIDVAHCAGSSRARKRLFNSAAKVIDGAFIPTPHGKVAVTSKQASETHPCDESLNSREKMYVPTDGFSALFSRSSKLMA
ncbi:MAG: hypothetical protein D8M59_04865 [Planctomycetes bacterium]|nr:hypothetical protein [Planctomycetota bacterium]